jgi:antitoxin (DNA-binding transcriptional repressor) of toxin-antitoxin stability system
MTIRVTIHAAKTQLSKLIAKAEAGEETVIYRGDKPAAKLVPIAQQGEEFERARPGRGSWKGRIRYAPDWEAPLDAEFLGLGPDGDFR